MTTQRPWGLKENMLVSSGFPLASQTGAAEEPLVYNWKQVRQKQTNKKQISRKVCFPKQRSCQEQPNRTCADMCPTWAKQQCKISLPLGSFIGPNEERLYPLPGRSKYSAQTSLPGWGRGQVGSCILTADRSREDCSHSSNPISLRRKC